MDSGEAWTGQGYPPVSLLRLNQADGRGELESLLQPRCLQGLPLSASTVTVRACLVIELRLTLCNPVDYSPLGSSVHGILQARMLEWVAMPSIRAIFPSSATHLPISEESHTSWVFLSVEKGHLSLHEQGYSYAIAGVGVAHLLVMVSISLS